MSALVTVSEEFLSLLWNITFWSNHTFIININPFINECHNIQWRVIVDPGDILNSLCKNDKSILALKFHNATHLFPSSPYLTPFLCSHLLIWSMFNKGHGVQVHSHPEPEQSMNLKKIHKQLGMQSFKLHAVIQSRDLKGSLSCPIGGMLHSVFPYRKALLLSKTLNYPENPWLIFFFSKRVE